MTRESGIELQDGDGTEEVCDCANLSSILSRILQEYRRIALGDQGSPRNVSPCILRKLVPQPHRAQAELHHGAL